MCSADVALTFTYLPRFLVLTVCDAVGSHDATQGKILLEDVGTEVSGISFNFLHRK